MAIRDIFDEYRKVQRANDRLLDVLRESLEVKRPVKRLYHDSWLPVSKVPHMCPRYQVIVSRLKLDLFDIRNAQDRWRADRGTALHGVMQESWLAPTGFILGGWRCPWCFHGHGVNDEGKVMPDDAIPCPGRCHGCGREWRFQEPFKYIEAWSEDHRSKVRGRIDAIVHLPAHAREVWDFKNTEIRGTEGRPWSVVRRPRAADVKQLHWYMDAAKCRRGRVVYIDPAAGEFTDAIVEHRVSFNPTLMHREREKIRVLREALQDESRPPPDCPHDRKLPFGDCPCVEVEGEWARHGD